MRAAVSLVLLLLVVPVALAQDTITKPPLQPKKDAGVLEAIRQLASDDPKERIRAAQFFIDHPDDRAFTSLLRHCEVRQEPVEEVRMNCVRALGELGMKEAYEPLLKILKEEPADTVKWVAVLALGQTNDPRAFDQLRGYIEKPTVPEWRFLAAYSIGYTKDKRALGVLQAALADKDENVRRDAARGLEAFASPEGCDILLAHIEKEQSGEAMRAQIRTLRELRCTGAPAVFDRLKKKLDTKDGEFKQIDQTMDMAAEVIRQSAPAK